VDNETNSALLPSSLLLVDRRSSFVASGGRVGRRHLFSKARIIIFFIFRP
jgi:hypothetical protein